MPTVEPRWKAPKAEKVRKPLRAKVRRLSTTEAATRARVFDRDGGCLLNEWSPCFGPLTPHHRRKASQGGKYEDDNLATLCAHHNDLIEADADLAAHCVAVGLVLRSTYREESP